MEYQEFLEYIGTLEFVDGDQTADAMIKAVLGMLCSSVDEPVARQLTEKLPDPLTLERLRGRQARKEWPSFTAFVMELRSQFDLTVNEALDLIDHVLRITRQAAGDDTWNQFTDYLPVELGEAMRKQ